MAGAIMRSRPDSVQARGELVSVGRAECESLPRSAVRACSVRGPCGFAAIAWLPDAPRTGDPARCMQFRPPIIDTPCHRQSDFLLLLLATKRSGMTEAALEILAGRSDLQRGGDRGHHVGPRSTKSCLHTVRSRRCLSTTVVGIGSLDIMRANGSAHHGADWLRVVTLKANSGQSAAVMAGVSSRLKAPIVATLDGDMQNDPRDIPSMLERVEAGDADAVVGVRAKRQDTFRSSGFLQDRQRSPQSVDRGQGQRRGLRHQGHPS